MYTKRQRLYVNVDHVATIRQARGSGEPSPLEAALLCEEAGADGITAHLREDRRHIQDADVEQLATSVRYFNLECACVDEMLAIAERLRPQQVTLVPERREEITTEGGLALEAARSQLRDAIARLREAGIRVSLFIDPDLASVDLSSELGANAVELHTGWYAHQKGSAAAARLFTQAARCAAETGLAVHAGHGLTARNLRYIAAIREIEELNIGHSIVSRAVLVGLHAAVREVRAAMDAARIA